MRINYASCKFIIAIGCRVARRARSVTKISTIKAKSAAALTPCATRFMIRTGPQLDTCVVVVGGVVVVAHADWAGRKHPASLFQLQ